MRHSFLFYVLLALSNVAIPQEPQEGIQYPKYQALRRDEDWSSLAGVDTKETDDPWDRIKYIPLTDDDSVWVSFGGHARARWENWKNFNFGMAPPGAETDDSFLLTRFLFHGDLHVGEDLRFFGEFKGAWSTDRDLPGGNRTLDHDDPDLQQLFLDYTFALGAESTVTLRPGRQEFLFGKQRLVSPLPWANVYRTWDGVSANWRQGDWSTVGFWSLFVPIEKHDFNKPDHDNPLYGVYSSYKTQGDPRQIDLYFLGFEKDSVTVNGTSWDEERYTIGGRLSDAVLETPIEYEVEGAYQFGEVGSGDVSAWFISSVLAYPFELTSESSRVWLGFDYASGDDSPGGDVGTFNQLFPLAHAYFGYIDAIARQNIIDYSVGASSNVRHDLTLAAAYHYLQLADNNDALYNAGGVPSIPGGTSSDRTVGSEVDLTAVFQWGRHTTFLAGYSHFFTGDVPDDAGPGEDTDFLYLQLTYVF